jgi:hypothetical protein
VSEEIERNNREEQMEEKEGNGVKKRMGQERERKRKKT